MRLGLVYIWATATAAMIFLYLVWTVGVYLLAVIDWVFVVITGSGVPVDPSWIQLHDEWVPRFRETIGYMGLASFVSLIIYVIVNSARKEPNYSPSY